LSPPSLFVGLTQFLFLFYSDDIFTLDELQDPMIKVQYSTGAVFGFGLEGMQLLNKK